ncbi:MAG: hypothetical protein ACPGGK_03465 [Pikeienuella sp.]
MKQGSKIGEHSLIQGRAIFSSFQGFEIAAEDLLFDAGLDLLDLRSSQSETRREGSVGYFVLSIFVDDRSSRVFGGFRVIQDRKGRAGIAGCAVLANPLVESDVDVVLQEYENLLQYEDSFSPPNSPIGLFPESVRSGANVRPYPNGVRKSWGVATDLSQVDVWRAMWCLSRIKVCPTLIAFTDPRGLDLLDVNMCAEIREQYQQYVTKEEEKAVRIQQIREIPPLKQKSASKRKSLEIHRPAEPADIAPQFMDRQAEQVMIAELQNLVSRLTERTSNLSAKVRELERSVAANTNHRKKVVPSEQVYGVMPPQKSLSAGMSAVRQYGPYALVGAVMLMMVVTFIFWIGSSGGKDPEILGENLIESQSALGNSKAPNATEHPHVTDQSVPTDDSPATDGNGLKSTPADE